MSKLTAAPFCLLLAVVSAAAPAVARAAPAAAASDRSALAAERERLRAELDRLNAEIDALKRAGHGVRDDYRLRARLADAEALARQLIAIEARLGLRAPATRPGPLPVAAPTDGPTDLDAKADILADESRRIWQEAETLDHRVVEIKGRQDLRRRVADLDRDPFAPLEGAKRRVVSIPGGDSSSRVSAPTPGTSGASSDHPGGTISLPQTGLTNPNLSTSTVTASASGNGTSAPPVPVTGTSAPGLSMELRDLLDPATVAEIRRLEGAKTPAGSVQALERAVAALRARADALDGQARAMRQTARAPH